MEDDIFVTRSSMPPIEEYTDEIKDLWESRRLTNMGMKHARFESALMEYLGVRNIALFANGHLALEGAISALKLTGEVITTPFTFASTTHAIVRSGLTPVFCDIRPDDFTIEADLIESLITEKTSAILPVHVYGNPCDVHKIAGIAGRHNLRVIYDAAHAFGVTVEGAGIANFGDASMFSFHAAKVFHSIEGGAAAFQDPGLKKYLDCEKNFGIDSSESIVHVGGNAKMNELQAAMGLCNLRYIDEEIAKRKIVSERYAERFDGVAGIKIPRPKDGVGSNCSYFPVLFDGYGYSRDEVFEKLKGNGIYARKYFSRLTGDFECYRRILEPGETPVARYISDRVLALPMYGDLSAKEIDRICAVIMP